MSQVVQIVGALAISIVQLLEGRGRIHCDPGEALDQHLFASEPA